MKNNTDTGISMLWCHKTFRIMRNTFFFLILAISSVFASSGYSQVTRFDLSLNNTTLAQVFQEIEKSSEFSVIYKSNEVNLKEKVSINAKHESIDNILNKVLKNQGLTYAINDKHIIIYKEEANKNSSPQQSRVTLTGTVIDNHGEAVIGASIVIKGTSNGVVSDLNGHFSLQVSANPPYILQISYIGLKPMEVTARPDQPLRVVMQEETKMMEEVVVTGYGNFKKSSYTGAATIISLDDLQDLPVVSVAQMLESKVPGVSFRGSSGQAGSFQNIRIRGTGSLNASNDPLFVLDGVPILSGNMSSDTNSAGGLDLFATLNPSDIESITILKDATSTSLYGARGSNGVILITTKKGQEGKTTYNFKANYGVSDFAMQYRPVMKGDERRELIYEGYVNQRLLAGDSQEKAEAYASANIDKVASIPTNGYADWEDVLFKKGHQQNYEFSANGGSTNTRFAASLSYARQTGISLSSLFERYTGRLSFTNTYKDFTLGVNALFTMAENSATPESSYYAGAVYTSRYTLTPSIPIYKEDGSYNIGFSNNGGYNPLHEDANSEFFTRIGRLIGSVNLDYKITDYLNVGTIFNIEYTNSNEFRYWGPESYDGRTVKGDGQKWRPERLNLNSNSKLNFSKTFNEKHHVDATAAFELKKYTRETLWVRAQNYGQNVNKSLSNAAKLVNIENEIDKDNMMSYVLFANYDYDNKYYLTGTYRHDGTSRLSPKSRWGDFWSVSGSWRISSESFMKPLEHWLSDLKIKASYGVTGTVPDDFYGYMGLYASDAQYGSFNASYESRIQNDRLKWEKGYNANIGFDAIFLGRISLSLDLYERNTKDLLMEKPLYAATGLLTMWDNVGHLRNRGYEIEMSSQNIQKKDFKWSSTLNLSGNKSKVIKTTDDHAEFVDVRMITREGEAYPTIYVIEYAGVDPQTGVAQYYSNQPDANGNLSREVITDPTKAAKICAADPAPNIAGSFGNTFSYKFVDLSFNLSFMLGGYTVDNAHWALQDDGYEDRFNKSTELRRRWKQPGDITDVPRYVNGNSTAGWYTSTRAIHSTNHLRLKSLVLGLNAPKKWLNTLGLSRARVYFSGTNLLTWAAYDQYDPEMGTQIGWAVPPLRNYSFGIEVSF